VGVFTCRACQVTPELVADGNAQLAIVRHQLGCLTQLAQSRARSAEVSDPEHVGSEANP
jgi:hypothetical protein